MYFVAELYVAIASHHAKSAVCSYTLVNADCIDLHAEPRVCKESRVSRSGPLVGLEMSQGSMNITGGFDCLSIDLDGDCGSKSPRAF